MLQMYAEIRYKCHYSLSCFTHVNKLIGFYVLALGCIYGRIVVSLLPRVEIN